MIYGYIRVSTDKQDTENQKLGINDKAKLLGFEIQEWISDDGVSGAKEPDDRLLGKLLKKVQKDDVIIASELSRLGRKLFMVMRILEHCMNVGAKVYTVKDGYELGDNIQSKVLAFAFGLAAEIEREMIQLRTIEGLKRKKLQGVLLGNSRTANINPHTPNEKQEQMKQLYEEGISLSEIGRRLKVHRLTVAFCLTKNGVYKPKTVIRGFNIKLSDDRILEINYQNANDYGMSYSFLKENYQSIDKFKYWGIKSIEAIEYTPEPTSFEKAIVFSKHPKINREDVYKMVFNLDTIPEMHTKISDVTYDELYDYVAGDTELSMMYRERGHLKVRSNRERSVV